MFIEKTDRCKRAIRLDNKDVFHIRRITERNSSLCKAVVYFVFHLIDHNDRIGGPSALNFEEKRGFDLFIRQPDDKLGFLKVAVLGSFSFFILFLLFGFLKYRHPDEEVVELLTTPLDLAG